MGTRTITFSVNSDVEQRFRRIAKATHSNKKGYLGKALTEAMEKWTQEKEQQDSVAASLLLLERGVDLGGLRYKHREELHDR